MARSGAWLLIAAGLAGCGQSAHDSEAGTGGGAGHARGGAGASAGSGATSGRDAGRGGGGQSGSGGGGGKSTGGTGGTGGAGGASGAGSGAAGKAAGGGGAAGAGAAGANGGESMLSGADGGGAGGEADLGPLGGLIEAFCTTARTCCSMAGLPVQALDHCEDSFLAQSGNVSLVATGKVTLDEAALAACIGAYQQAETSCTIDGIEAACHGILVGSVADNGACTDVAECDRSQGAKVCQQFLDGDGVGTCQTPPRGQDGDPCSMSCPVDSSCSVTSVSPNATYPTTLCYEADGLYCQGGYSCMPLVDNADSCMAPDACGSGAYCDGESCAPLIASGGECSFGPACGRNFACENGHCTPTPFANSSACVGYPPSFD
jgi:hypothetical protein